LSQKEGGRLGSSNTSLKELVRRRHRRRGRREERIGGPSRGLIVFAQRIEAVEKERSTWPEEEKVIRRKMSQKVKKGERTDQY